MYDPQTHGARMTGGGLAMASSYRRWALRCAPATYVNVNRTNAGPA